VQQNVETDWVRLVGAQVGARNGCWLAMVVMGERPFGFLSSKISRPTECGWLMRDWGGERPLVGCVGGVDNGRLPSLAANIRDRLSGVG